MNVRSFPLLEEAARFKKVQSASAVMLSLGKLLHSPEFATLPQLKIGHNVIYLDQYAYIQLAV